MSLIDLTTTVKRVCGPRRRHGNALGAKTIQTARALRMIGLQPRLIGSILGISHTSVVNYTTGTKTARRYRALPSPTRWHLERAGRIAAKHAMERQR